MTAKEVANYLLFKSNSKGESNDTSNLKLQKLLYYCQGFHLAIKGTALFSDKILHWDHGPVVESLYHEFKTNGANPIEYKSEWKFDNITANQKEVIDEVFGVYDQFSAWQLRNMSHNESPWKDTQDCEEIPINSMKTFFLTRIEQ